MIRRLITLYRLNRSMKPDPGYRTKRLAQFSPERRERYWANIKEIGL